MPWLPDFGCCVGALNHLFSRVQRVRARWLSRGFLRAMLLPTLSFATSTGLSSAKFKKF